MELPAIQPYALPLGPVIAQSNPSLSNYARTDAEQINAQQKAYAEALLEQNVALKKRIDELQQKDSTIQNLQGEIERLKKNSIPARRSNRCRLMARLPDPSSAKPDDFSKVNNLDFTDPSEVMLLPRSEADYQVPHHRCGSMTSCLQNSAPLNDAGSRSFRP